MTRARCGISAAPVLLCLLFGGFVVAIGYLVASSLGRRNVAVFTPSSAKRVRRQQWERGGDTLTVDATDADRWRFLSLSRGTTLEPPDTAGWELAVRRYRIMAADAMADAGVVPFERVATTQGLVFVGRAAGGDSTNDAVRRWYRYGMMTHLLEPNGHVYILRTPSRRLLKVQILSYYCPGPTAGCLTLRYAPATAAPRTR